MAKAEHVAIVMKGAGAISEWQKAYPQSTLNLSRASLIGANLSRAKLGSADLSGADLQGANLRKAKLQGVNFRRANISRANLSKADLTNANLAKSNLSMSDLGNASLRDADLCDANLRKSRLTRSDLSGARLTGADLTEADIAEASLRGANLTSANLKKANLSEATLVEADLFGAYLGSVDLSRADLGSARLLAANLTGANLTEANLTGTNLTEAVLKMANLRTAVLWNTNFSSCDLSQTWGLEEVSHSGPSDIGIQTITRSNGRVPEAFLRGCGVPQTWITYIPALLRAMQPIQYHSCFISYSHADKAFARRLHDTLQGRGIRCWLDEHQLLPGDDPHEQIDRGIRLWDKVLLCASKVSLTSWWVDKEIAAAFKKEQRLMKERGKKTLALIPLDLDGFLFSDDCQNPKATEVQERIAAKFAGWDRDNVLFQREFARLIRALQPNDAGREPPPVPML